MLTLEQQQHTLFALIRQYPAGGYTDPWLENVASSRGLRMIHQIALWWQRFQLESQCRYTSRMMKRINCFEQYIAEYFRVHPTPPSIEELSAQFLSSLQDHNHPVLRAVAQLELACISTCAATIYWDRNPNQVMDALDHFGQLPEPEPNVRYVLQMGANLPNKISCVREVLRDQPRAARIKSSSHARF
jgi:hypothetical protein